MVTAREYARTLMPAVAWYLRESLVRQLAADPTAPMLTSRQMDHLANNCAYALMDALEQAFRGGMISALSADRPPCAECETRMAMEKEG